VQDLVNGMMTTGAIPQELSKAVAASADVHLREHQMMIWRRTDRLFGGLLMFEWAAATAIPWVRSPLAWDGGSSSLHPHIWTAFVLGGWIIALPIFLVLKFPGRQITRHVVAAGQILMSALLIHLGDGRIEMHFHVFGSLAFLAFYRDWRVLITATVVISSDHLLRGIYAPMSVYGVLSASLWRTAEHAGWVIFEDIFLIGACVQGVAELHGIATNRALLEHSYRDVEQKITQRTDELKNAQAELLKTARAAGMAEIATSVLHNVGNVLNSVNVSATIVADKLRQSEVPSLAKVTDMMSAHRPDLAAYITSDARGKMIPDFLTDLADCLGQEQKMMLDEVTNLAKGIEHIKQIVAAQQSMAKSSNVGSAVKAAEVMETALSIQATSMNSSIEVLRDYQFTSRVMLDQHKVLQVLINLIGNARQAVMDRPAGQRRITLTVKRIACGGAERIAYQVGDSGVGIAPENITRIFSHGFTTKKEGHGFGLHSAANAAREMSGELSVTSGGVNQGAVFRLEVPLTVVSEESICTR
jgi:signal transduction histidine kinase